ncbi:MAG: DNA polymerase III subunit delta [Oscillospiraceae bacterium]
MPAMETGGFRRHVESGEFSAVYFLYGAEKYLLKRACNKLVKKAKGESFPEFNFNEFSSESGVDAIADAALSLPFMAERKCVMVSDLNIEQKSQSELNKLTELLESLSPSTVLIFSLPTVLVDFKKSTKWRNFLKAIEKAGTAVEFKPLETGELVKFLLTEAEKQGSHLTKQLAVKIVEYAGNDLTNLSNEIKKLAAFARDREITGEDVEELVTKNLETTVFILAKSMISGNYARAYELLDILFYSGERAVPILSVLSASFVDMYRVRAALQSGKTCLAPAEYENYKGREFRLRNAERDIRGVSTSRLRQFLQLLLETDLLLKSSRLSEKVVLEEMVAKFLVLSKGKELC